MKENEQMSKENGRIIVLLFKCIISISLAICSVIVIGEIISTIILQRNVLSIDLLYTFFFLCILQLILLVVSAISTFLKGKLKNE